MTKKELLDMLLENKYFKELPDNTQVVFRTNEKLRLCQAVKPDQISAAMQFEPDKFYEAWWQDKNCKMPPPGIRSVAIVIDALPRDFIKEQFNTTFCLQ